jgi:CBS domain-containing protein
MDDLPKPGWLERLSALLLREPGDREQLLALLRCAYERNLFDSDALNMIEGAIQVSEMQARDIMIPRSQMDVIDISEPPEKFIPFVIEKAHSRFPVTENDKNNVIGILLAKDLLRYHTGEEFNVRDTLRPVVFIPEAKRLNVLLKDFRTNRNHIAIVVDEYGAVAGLVTIEDVLEQIVAISRMSTISMRQRIISYKIRMVTTVSRQLPKLKISMNGSGLISVIPSTTPWAAWYCTSSADYPRGEKALPTANSSSRCCARTAAGYIPCWLKRFHYQSCSNRNPEVGWGFF